jgi:hypothetical protein
MLMEHAIKHNIVPGPGGNLRLIAVEDIVLDNAA